MELGITLPAAPGRLAEFGAAARRAEDSGFSGVFMAEAMHDSLALAIVTAMATRRAVIGTAITNIYFRHPSLTATAASNIQEVSGGRFILGLGTSHRVMNEPRGIDMGRPLATMREYVRVVRAGLAGDPPPPVYLGALRKGMTRLAGEVGDGVIFTMVPLDRTGEWVETVREGERRRPEGGPPARIASLIGTYVTEDIESARELARERILFRFRMEYYRNQMVECGYPDEVQEIGRALDAGDQARAMRSIDDDMLDQYYILGPRERCLERLQRFRDQGIDLPILSPGSSAGDFSSGFDSIVAALGPSA